jgi:hypothetical protein
MSNFVLVDAVISAPVVLIDHWVAAHGWGMASASANNLGAFWLYWRVAKFGSKPDAGRALHARASV